MLDELDDEMLDFDSNVNNLEGEKVDSTLIKKILSEMKSEFNKTSNNPTAPNISSPKEEEFSYNNAEDADSRDNSKLDQEDIVEGEDSPTCLEDEATPKESSDHCPSNIEVYSSTLDEKENCYEITKHSEENELPDTLVVKSHEDDEGEDTVESYQTSEGIDSTPQEVESRTILESTCSIDDINKEVDSSPPEDTVNISESVSAETNVLTESSSPPPESEETFESKKSKVRVPRAAIFNDNETNLKRSSRRMSKENSRESVLQSAIALKEKSFSSLQNDDKPQRRSSRLADSEKSLSTRLRNKALRYELDPLSDSSYNACLKINAADKTPRCSTEDETELDSKFGSQKSLIADNKFTSEYDEFTEQKLLDSGSSESYNNDVSPSKIIRKRRKPGPIPGFKRKKTGHNNSFGTSLSIEEKLISQCECRILTNLYVKNSNEEELLFCTGVDSIEKKAVGCDNLADISFPLIRPLPRVPFQSLCSVHVDRILRHNCCPLCGVFCTRGMFMYCKSGHFYHKDCDLFYDNYTLCPHCGGTDTKEVTLVLAKTNNPFFLPTQKLFDKSVSARISAMPINKLNENKIESDLCSTPNLVLPSGLELSIVGAPLLERDLLKKCLSAFTSKNADLNCRFTNRNIFQAAKTGDIEKMIQILWSGLSPNVCLKEGTPLHAACRNGHIAMVHILVQGGACVDALDKDQYTPLMVACQQGHFRIVQYLIGAGAQRAFKGAGGMTALHVAAKEGHLDCCFYLLSNTSSPSSIVDALDEGNWTALVWAAENNQVEVVRFLIRKKANIHLRDTERNIAIHWAALAGSLDIVEDLLNEGSDMNATNIYGDTPLHIAAREGSVECVMLLLSRGAIPDMVNKAAMVPRDCCRVPNPFIYDLISVSMKFALVTANIPLFPRVLTNDISRGKEVNPIQCINEIDDDGIPTDFTYVTENCFTTNVQVDNRITSLIPCKCEDNCTSNNCACTLNSKGCWYDSSGKLVADFNYEDPPLVFECNPACHCNTLTCVNRVVQKGIKVHLQMCKTQTKHWGVITLKDIPKGTYVCEYIGEIISDLEADTRQDDSYLFDLDNKEKESYCIDARWYGNITRFINHSCKPNLFPVRVFINHHDLRFPRIAFFAARDIPSHEELGFDYGEKFWMIKYKTFTCTCGADNCRYSSETIQQTVIRYNESLKLEEEQLNSVS